MTVTDAGGAPSAVVSRNGARRRLIEKEIKRRSRRRRAHPISLALYGTEEGARNAGIAIIKHHTTYACDRCDTPFEEGDTVYIRVHRGAFCRDCAARWHPSWLEQASEPVRCEGGCGVLVSSWGLVRRRRTCSPRCTQVARRQRRRKQPVVAACAGCGGSLPEGRADRRYCSGACKQRAYRQRTNEVPS